MLEGTFHVINLDLLRVTINSFVNDVLVEWNTNIVDMYSYNVEIGKKDSCLHNIARPIKIENDEQYCNNSMEYLNQIY